MAALVAGRDYFVLNVMHPFHGRSLTYEGVDYGMHVFRERNTSQAVYVPLTDDKVSFETA